ncbi:MAG: TonB-dependent receptor [Bacteroidales bacterium]|nr:TonB-dependent receptor [Bacteroidales bacterium]
MNKRFHTVFCLLILAFLTVFGQADIVLKGKVTDSKTGEQLIGVTVIEVNELNRTLNGTVTDMNGNFVLRLNSPNTRVKISYIGYKTDEFIIEGQEFLEVRLLEETKELDEVVITYEGKKIGGFMPVSERDITSAVTKVDMEDLEETKTSNLGEMLQGRASNVDISMASGDPGAGMSVRIRGTASISGSNQPLIVVDGVPFEIELDNDFDFSAVTQEQFSGLLNIAPEDILSIQVLKDAASTAVWGSRGANGVLLIETKRGVKGKTSFDYLYKLSVQQQPGFIPLLDGDSYAMLMLEGILNAGSTEIPDELSYNKDWEEYYNYSQNTDWLSAITQTGISHEHNFSLSGGGESALYRFSLGYLDQDGTTSGTGFQRITSRFNLDYHVSEKLLFSGDLSYTYSDNDLSYKENANANSVRALSYIKAPNMSMYEYDKEGNLTDNYFSPGDNFQGQAFQWFNPLAMANEATWNRQQHRLRTKLQLKYDILDNLVFQSFVAYDLDDQLENKFLPQVVTGSPWTSPYANLASGMDYQSSVLETQSQFVYTYLKGSKHKVTSMLAFTLSDKKNGWYYGSTSNLPSAYLVNYAQHAPVYWIGDGYSQNRMLALLGFVHYSLLDRYLVQVNVRREGSSRFGYESRWGTFPSVSVAYRVSSEPFMSKLPFINDLKLRYSYGVNGNQPGSSYGYFNLYSTNMEYIDMPVVIPVNLQLDHFRWERNSQINYGVDLSALNNYLEIHFDVYNQKSKDLIWENLDLPSTSGFPNITRNWGSMDNKGWEVTFVTDVLRREELNLDLNFNIAHNENRITEIPENFDFEYETEANNGQYARRAIEGHPIGAFYGFRYLGVYPTDADAVATDAEGDIIYDISNKPLYMRYGNADGYRFRGGDAIYEDINSDGLINELDIVKLGDSNPDFIGGFGSKAAWKNLVVTLFFHYRLGQDIVNRTKMYNENMYGRNNQSVAVLNRWRRQGDITDIPRALYNQGYNWLGSDRFVEDGSFLRFKSASISYNFRGLASKLNIREIKVYFMVYNLYTWTNYTGVDPEVPMLSNDPFFIGEDKADTPAPKSYMLSVNFKF